MRHSGPESSKVASHLFHESTLIAVVTEGVSDRVLEDQFDVPVRQIKVVHGDLKLIHQVRVKYSAVVGLE